MSFERERARRHLHDVEHHGEPAAPAAVDHGIPDLRGAVVQAHAAAGSMIDRDPDRVHEQAARGVAGGGGSLPHLDRIQASFGGAHDLSSVRAHVGGDAAPAARAIGAEAYTTGNQVAFQRDPDLFLAAHEATHVVQQRGGVQLKSAVGAAGDVHEQQADAVAARVVAGESAADLLPGAAVDSAPAIQRYQEVEEMGKPGRMSESGQTLILGEDSYSQMLFATEAMVKDANGKLEAAGDQGSHIKLVVHHDWQGVKPAQHVLFLVEPVFQPRGDKNKGLKDKNQDNHGELKLWADCGRAARTVMGSEGQTAPHAIYGLDGKPATSATSLKPQSYSDEIYLKTMPGFLAHKDHTQFLTSGVHYQDSADKIITPKDGKHAREQYWGLGSDGRDAFDKVVGINGGANPEVGGGYTINTEKDMPGYQEDPTSTWNFHWGGVIMKDGGDNVTLENYAVGDGNAVNTDWNFQMYGTAKKEQTFHEQHLASDTHGNRATTFAVEGKGKDKL